MKIRLVGIFVLALSLSFSAKGEQLDNQDVDVSSGSTLSNASLVVRQLNGGLLTLIMQARSSQQTEVRLGSMLILQLITRD